MQEGLGEHIYRSRYNYPSPRVHPPPIKKAERKLRIIFELLFKKKRSSNSENFTPTLRNKYAVSESKRNTISLRRKESGYCGTILSFQ